jgi:hypothetical protein
LRRFAVPLVAGEAAGGLVSGQYGVVAFAEYLMAFSCYEIGTKVEFTVYGVGFIFLLEQTRGRAVRASQNSQEFGALLICGHFFRHCLIPGLASTSG